jgi:hypothetical protein
MKNLFNDISQEEKNRILEMHSGKKNVISEQNKPKGTDKVKELVGDLKEKIDSALSNDIWRDTDDLLELYNMLLPFKGKTVSGNPSKRYFACDEDMIPMRALQYFYEIYPKRANNEYCMGNPFDFFHRINTVGDKTFSGGTEKSKDGKYTTPQVKKMIIQLVQNG